MGTTHRNAQDLSQVAVTLGKRGDVLDRDNFCRTLIGELTETLEDVVGLAESAGFVAVVGHTMGRHLDAAYREALGADRLDRDQVAEVLVDLKHRIGGGFSIESIDDDRIVLVNDACPFEDRVVGRESLCMMTSNVFGSITAENLGYAKVSIDEAIARGDTRCRVAVWTRPSQESLAAEGREYFAAPAVPTEGAGSSPS